MAMPIGAKSLSQLTTPAVHGGGHSKRERRQGCLIGTYAVSAVLISWFSHSNRPNTTIDPP